MRDIKQLNSIAYDLNQIGQSLKTKLSNEELYEYMYEDDVFQKENKMEIKPTKQYKTFITPEQAQLNQEQYINKLKTVTNWTEFYKITKCVDPVMTNDQSETKFFFFPKGGMKEYWAVRKQKAAELSASRDQNIKKYLNKLEGTGYEEQIKELARLKADGALSARDKQSLIQTYNAKIYETYNLQVA